MLFVIIIHCSGGVGWSIEQIYGKKISIGALFIWTEYFFLHFTGWRLTKNPTKHSIDPIFRGNIFAVLNFSRKKPNIVIQLGGMVNRWLVEWRLDLMKLSVLCPFIRRTFSFCSLCYVYVWHFCIFSYYYDWI